MQPAKPSRELHDEILYAYSTVYNVTIRSMSSPCTTDLYHILTWPQLSYVAEDEKGRIVGYILAKMCATISLPAPA